VQSVTSQMIQIVVCFVFIVRCLFSCCCLLLPHANLGISGVIETSMLVSGADVTAYTEQAISAALNKVLGE
jgi:hypothetical protein